MKTGDVANLKYSIQKSRALWDATFGLKFSRRVSRKMGRTLIQFSSTLRVLEVWIKAGEV